jgi:putative mRNA 3-end processing factor
MARLGSWIEPFPEGIYVKPADAWVDPSQPRERALITHGHADHARGGHGAVWATPGTLAIMDARYGQQNANPVAYGDTISMGDVEIGFVPAGHVLGSAQIVLDYRGERVVVSGDYKRRPDPTCAGFEPQRCDVFVTEATFALPVFRHPPDTHEIEKLLHTLRLFPERCHLIGVYALGKCQRVIALLRAAGYDEPIYLHGALLGLTELYGECGIKLGPVRHITGVPPDALRGQIVLAPPGALGDRWTRRLPDPVAALASGWMRVKQRAKACGVELPLVISDHADWDELTATLDDVGASGIWVTHGREEALVHYAQSRGLAARALQLTGFGDEEE